jgi:hypothetical protein
VIVDKSSDTVTKTVPSISLLHRVSITCQIVDALMTVGLDRLGIGRGRGAAEKNVCNPSDFNIQGLRDRSEAPLIARAGVRHITGGLPPRVRH